MTLLFCEGFEGVSPTYAARVFNSGSYVPADMTTYTGRFGIGKAWGRPGSNTSTSRFYLSGDKYGISPNAYGYICGFAAKRTSSSANALGIYSYMLSGSYGDAWGMKLTPSVVRVKAWDSDYPAYDYPVPQGTWCYIEFRFRGHASAGFYEARVNGTVIYSWGPGDTLYSSSNNHTGFFIHSDAWVGYQIDDLYFLVQDGSGKNTFLGDCRVDTILANGNGTTNDMTPSAGNNYECINDDPNDPNDYVEAEIDGDLDLYTFPDVPTEIDDSYIHGVTLDHMAKRTQPVSNVESRNVVRSNGSLYYGSQNWALNDTTADIKKNTFETDPDDSNPWTQAKINACEFGVELNKT